MAELHTPEQHFQVSGPELHRHVRALCWKMNEQYPKVLRGIKAIAGVSRGGLAPMGYIARELEIRLCDTLCVASYHSYQKRGRLKILKDLHPDVLKAIGPQGEGLLIVDDLVDSGNTFRILQKRYPKAFYIALYTKPKGKRTVQLSFLGVSQETWIYLPWDCDAVTLQYVPPIIESIDKKKRRRKDAKR
jgi:xanthine phosphoribosyltransferase